MIWVVLSVVLLVLGSVAFFVVSALRKVGWFTGWRAKIVYVVCYFWALFAMYGLADTLGPLRWWLPLAVFAAVAIVVGLPLHFWEKRQLARQPRDDRWTPT